MTEDDIQFFKTMLPDVLPRLELACVRNTAGLVVGFVGVSQRNVDMLFIHADWRGQGIGRRLLQYAIDTLQATTLDVNEQNPQALGFYLHLGFEVTGRSEQDGSNKPYPLLHMRLNRAD